MNSSTFAFLTFIHLHIVQISTWTKHDERLWTEPLTVTLKPELENSILVFCHSLIIIQLKSVFLKTRLLLPHWFSMESVVSCCLSFQHYDMLCFASFLLCFLCPVLSILNSSLPLRAFLTFISKAQHIIVLKW
jgi:hypothetical protein